MWICSSCGKKFVTDIAECPVCSGKVMQEETIQKMDEDDRHNDRREIEKSCNEEFSQETSRKNKSKKMKIIIVVIIIVAVAAAAFGIYKYSEPRELIICDGDVIETTIGEPIELVANAADLTEKAGNNLEWKLTFDSGNDNKKKSKIENGRFIPLEAGEFSIYCTTADGLRHWKGWAEVEVNYESVEFENGEFVSGSQGNAPVKINNENENAYLYFKNISGGEDFSFLVTSGSEIKPISVEVSAPMGRYKLYYVLGETWYGAEHLFGLHGEYHKYNEVLNFYQEGNTLNGVELSIPANSTYMGGELVKKSKIAGEISEEEFLKYIAK